MSKFGPEVSPNGAPALPLWIGGRAYLTVVEAFFDVRRADGAVHPEYAAVKLAFGFPP